MRPHAPARIFIVHEGAAERTLNASACALLCIRRSAQDEQDAVVVRFVAMKPIAIREDGVDGVSRLLQIFRVYQMRHVGKRKLGYIHLSRIVVRILILAVRLRCLIIHRRTGAFPQFDPFAVFEDEMMPARFVILSSPHWPVLSSK